MIPALQPDIVVLVNVARSTKTASTTLTAGHRAVAAAAGRPGRTLVLVEPVVESPPDDPPLRAVAQFSLLVTSSS